MPFSDPVADGPLIQAAGMRALKGGMTLRKTLAMVKGLRAHDPDTPYVLMGYYNPIYRYGAEAFAKNSAAAGVDALIIVDLPRIFPIARVASGWCGKRNVLELICRYATALLRLSHGS